MSQRVLPIACLMLCFGWGVSAARAVDGPKLPPLDELLVQAAMQITADGQADETTSYAEHHLLHAQPTALVVVLHALNSHTLINASDPMIEYPDVSDRTDCTLQELCTGYQSIFLPPAARLSLLIDHEVSLVLEFHPRGITPVRSARIALLSRPGLASSAEHPGPLSYARRAAGMSLR